MYKFKEFFGNLSKSTRLTVISCGIFIILTFIILMFFVMFPITPSEKVISGMGRAGVMDSEGKISPYGDDLNGVVVTTSANSSGNKNESTVTTANTQVTHPKVHYVDKIFTTNEGYVYTGYAVPTGRPDYSNQTVTQAVENYQEPVYTEPPQPYEPEPQPEISETDVPYEPTVPDISEPDIPPEPTEYVEPDVPVVTDPPVIDEPPVVDPPSEPEPEPEPVPSYEPDEPSSAEPEL